MKLVECFRCDNKFLPKDLFHVEGCSLCRECYEHIQVTYAVEMLKEEGINYQTSKCKGCEG